MLCTTRKKVCRLSLQDNILIHCYQQQSHSFILHFLFCAFVLLMKAIITTTRSRSRSSHSSCLNSYFIWRGRQVRWQLTMFYYIVKHIRENPMHSYYFKEQDLPHDFLNDFYNSFQFKLPTQSYKYKLYQIHKCL